jgi:acetoin:2,6-dichlorophenolindophenol oxidoreductase subunit alpha
MKRYSEHTAYEKCTAAKHVADRAASYQMPGVTVDGNDPLAVYSAASEAIERAREGNGPTLIEALTFRFNGHNMGDNDSYMPVELKKQAMERDPVPLFRAKLISAGIATEAELTQIEQRHDQEIEAAIQFALDSPFPDIAELRRDVYAEELQ